MALLSAETAAPFQLLSLSFFHLACADGPPSPSPWFWLLRRWCMLSHECEFAPASLLDLACLLTLSSSSQGPPTPPHPIRGLTPPAESAGEENEEIMEPCGALMSCRAVRLREIINLDNLSRHNTVGSLSTLRTRADIRVTSLPPQVRQTKERERPGSDSDGGPRLGRRMLIPQGELVLWQISFFL